MQSGVICPTPTIEKIFSKINKRTTVVANFPKLYKSSITKKLSSNIVYIGSISKSRGIIEIMKALELLNKDIKLHLCGDFSDKNTEELIKNMKSWSKVKYHGFLNTTQIREILSRCAIGLVILRPYKSYKEAYPIKMFEYMNEGLPVIA